MTNSGTSDASGLTPDRTTTGPAHNSTLDGIRAVAVFMVLLFHAGAPLMGFGWIGVDLFFVLSGFLITSILCREYGTTGTISFKNFMARRFLRIMPPYFLYASLLTVLIVTGFGTAETHATWSPGWLIASIWGYFNNFLPRGGIWEYNNALAGHLWSLSVEEQFYLVWPFTFLVAVRSGKPVLICALLCVSMFVSRYFHDGFLQNYMLHTRGIGLGIGCLAAVTVSSSRYRETCGRWFANPAVTLCIYILNGTGLVALAALSSLKTIPESIVIREIVPWLDLCFALWIASVWLNPQASHSRWLAWKPLVYIGAISYGIYLYHLLAHFVVWNVLLAHIDDWPKVPKFGVRLLVFLALSICMAALSYRILEKPFLNLKDRFRANAARR